MEKEKMMKEQQQLKEEMKTEVQNRKCRSAGEEGDRAGEGGKFQLFTTLLFSII